MRIHPVEGFVAWLFSSEIWLPFSFVEIGYLCYFGNLTIRLYSATGHSDHSFSIISDSVCRGKEKWTLPTLEALPSYAENRCWLQSTWLLHTIAQCNTKENLHTDDVFTGKTLIWILWWSPSGETCQRSVPGGVTPRTEACRLDVMPVRTFSISV